MQSIRLAALLLLVPASVFAAHAPASFSAGRSVLAANSSLGNAYFAGASIVSTASIAGDLSAFGGSVVVAAPVRGDALLFSGSTNVRAPISGDLRAVGGNIDIEEAVGGDIAALGYDVYDSGRAGGNVFIVAANTTLTNGAEGPVTIYGNNIALGGDFTGDVTIFASGRLTLAAGTTIHGALSYEAPETANIPASAVIVGGVAYKNASYLPDAGTSRILAFASVGFFLIARILGALILAGLLAGLFPRLAHAIAERALTRRVRSVLLTMLLGFAILVAVPVLLVLLSLTFVGLGLALLLLVLYALLVLLALLYAGILFGSMYARYLARRETILWHDGVLGMLVLSLIALVPYIGSSIAVLIMLFTAGALLQLFYSFAFPHEEHTPEML